MAKDVKEVEKYPDGKEIVRYPKWVYPGGKPEHSSPKKEGHNGILVNNKEEEDAVLNPGKSKKPDDWKN